MDETSSSRNPKEQKLNNKHDMTEDKRSLDELPDEVLRHILTFLPMKDCFKTKLLSKRWENIWTSVSNLSFNERRFPNREFFMNLVERVLDNRGSTDIRKFHLQCDVFTDASKIKKWISSAIRHNVQSLRLNLPNWEQPHTLLPLCLFACESLRRLTLQVYDVLMIPPSICLSNLKILKLLNVTFPNVSSTQQLFAGCPVLEELIIRDCLWGNCKVVSISAPKLKCLTIFEGGVYDYGSLACEVMIFGSNLAYFCYNGSFHNDYNFYDVSSLKYATICVDTLSGRQRQIAHRAYKLLRGVSSTAYLAMSYQLIKVQSYEAELIDHMPVFSNLTLLLFASATADLRCKAVQKILLNSPLLESLQFGESINLSSDCEVDDKIFYPLPSCFSSDLAEIVISKYNGKEEEQLGVKFLLNYCTSLQEMRIHSDASEDDQTEFYEDIFDMLRGSDNCAVVFPDRYG